MRIANYARLPEDDLQTLERDVASHATLLDALAFAGRLHSRPVIPSVVVQDEYSHDVVFPWRDGLYLVYATT